MTLSIVDGPSKGSLGAISGDAVTYTPDAGEYGADSFTYGANDGTADSAPATAHLTITPPAGLRGRHGAHRGRHGGPGAARVHGSRRRHADLLQAQRSRQGHARRRSRAARSSTRPTPASSGPTPSPTAPPTAPPTSAPATVDVTISRPPACDDVAETVRVGSSVSVPLTCSDPDGDELDARDRRRPVAGQPGRDLRRLRDLHAGRGRPGRGHVHLHRLRRHRRLPGGHGDDHAHRPAALRTTSRAARASRPPSRCRWRASTPTATP